MQSVYKDTLPNQMYYTHGIYEFSLLRTRPDEKVFTLGTYIFDQYLRIFRIAFPKVYFASLDNDAVMYRNGVFTTFFGDWWIEFGYVGIVLLFLIGFGLTRLADFVRQGYLNVLPLYLFSIVLVLLMPVVDLLGTGFGFFMMHGFGLFAMFTSFGKAPGSSARRANLAPRGPVAQG